MRILIATGIFPPESGGPATYAEHLAKYLSTMGHTITVVTYADADTSVKQYSFALVRVARGNKILNRVRFLLAAMRVGRGSEVIYALDWFAAGLPAAIAAIFLRIPYVVRVGGDYLWEQRYLSSGAPPMSLHDFYERDLHRRVRYAFFFHLIRCVLRHAAKVVFNSDMQRELYETHYRLDPAKTFTIHNPVPHVTPKEGARGEPTRELIFWGRLIVMKNVESLIRAFAHARIPAGYTVTIIGDGPEKAHLQALVRSLGLTERISFLPAMSRADVLERVKNARAFILPSWTDIAPNQVYEALAIGLPGIVTQENYLPIRDQLPDMIDPNSIDDIADKIEMLTDDERYAAFSKAFRAIRFGHDWNDAAREHIRLFES